MRQSKVKNAKHRSTRNWAPEEILQSIPGPGLGSAVAEHQIMNARAVDGNYRKAEQLALLAARPVDHLQSLRVSLARGNLDRAKAQIAQLRTDRNFKEIEPEILLDSARLHAAQGQWAKAVSSCSEGLDCPETSSITRLSLLQVRANAFYEHSEMRKLFGDLEEASSLVGLYPNAPTAFYIEILRFKAELSVYPPERVFERFKLWRAARFLESPPTFDLVLALLRLEIEIRRALSLPTAKLAFACAEIAATMGDQLYEALAWLDLAVSENAEARSVASLELTARRAQFIRVSEILEDLFSKKPRTETAKRLLLYRTLFKTRNHSTAASPAFQFTTHGSFRYMVIIDGPWILDLRAGTTLQLALQDRIKSILAYFAAFHSGTKAELFAGVWKIKNYQVERHDITVRTALRRLKKQVGIPLKSENGVLSFQDALVI